jgi:3D (Asp-Asp-Asp) domain-containing protein
MINGETYIVEDRGVGSGVIDIYFDSHSEALSFGVQYAKVFSIIE